MEHSVKDIILEFGNTNLKLGFVDQKNNLFVETYVLRIKGLSLPKLRAAAEHFAKTFFPKTLKDYPEAFNIAYSSVNLKASKIYIEALRKHLDERFSFFEVNNTYDFSFHINVKNPEEVGIDLLCDAEAALVHAHDVPTFIIDLGTLTKIIFLNKIGDEYFFEGVNIGPGIKSMLESFKTDAKHLSFRNHQYYFNSPESSIGTDTITALQNGTGYMFALMCIKAIEEIAYEFLDADDAADGNYHILLCGGASELLTEMFTFVGNREELSISHFGDLALYGTYCCYYNRYIGSMKEDA